jgi:hypothetical protein
LSTLIRRYESGARGLPDHGCYFTISQSQFERWACPRKGWFTEIEGLRTGPTAEMRLGTAWDAWKRDVWTWWMERDQPYPESGLDRCAWCDGAGCERCDGSGASALTLASDTLAEAGEEVGMESSEVERQADALRRMAEGWVAHFEGGRLQSYEVAGVQVALARQILNPRTGKPYAPVVYLTDAEPQPEVTPLGFEVQAQRWRLSRTGERGSAVAWPWYQIGAIDVLMRHRQTRLGYPVDDKASASLSKYADSVKIDPQLPGYCWLLEPHAEAMDLSGVGGFFYEVASTRYQRDPEFLEPKWPPMDELRQRAKVAGLKVEGRTKEDYIAALGIPTPPRELSRNTSAFTPSWRYLRALREAGLREDVYADHLEHLRHTVDPECYARAGMLMLPYSAQVGARYSRELFARVELLADKRRAAALSTSVHDLDLSFPRVPICKLGARCSFTHVCPVHEPDVSSIRTGFGSEVEQVWGVVATTSSGGVNERDSDRDPGDGEEVECAGPCAGGF